MILESLMFHFWIFGFFDCILPRGNFRLYELDHTRIVTDFTKLYLHENMLNNLLISQNENIPKEEKP